MPLYDYRCTECDREVEVMHGINESGPETCEHCGGAMRKALSPPAIHFKGSGWAKKDAAAATAKKSTPKTGGTADKAAPKDAAKSTAGDDAKSTAGSTSSSAGEAKGKPATTAGSTTD